MTDSEGWIPTQRTNPQIWIFLAISLPFILAGIFLFDGPGGASLGPVPVWAIEDAVIVAIYLTLQLTAVNSRRPRAVRLTPAAIEVRMLFGGVRSLPRESARLRASWPAGFGNLRSPVLTAWVALDPNQYSIIGPATRDDHPDSADAIDPVAVMTAVVRSTVRVS